MPNKIFCEFWVPSDLQTVWNFFSDARALTTLTPSYFHVNVRGDSETRKGNTIHLSMNPFGIPLNLKWDAQIQEVSMSQSEISFVDVQVKGPFRSWKHKHIFREGNKKVGNINLNQAGTWCRDELEYEAPVLDNLLIDQILFRRILGSMFAYRKKALYEKLLKS